MKNRFSSFIWIVCAAALTGCATREVRTARSMGTIDTIPDSSSKGYVEFYTRAANGPVAIYLMDDQGNAQPLAAVGVREGDKYQVRDGMRVSERLRVAAPAGTHTFALHKNGPQIQVEVEPNKVTEVQLDYDPIEPADHFVVFRLDSEISEPRALAEAVGSAPRSE
jgi:hypothetical protein